MKTKNTRKVKHLQQTPLSLHFVFGKIPVRKHSLSIPSLCHYIFNVAFCITRYLKRSHETPTSMKICVGSVEAVLQPQILGNKLDMT